MELKIYLIIGDDIKYNNNNRSIIYTILLQKFAELLKLLGLASGNELSKIKVSEKKCEGIEM